MNRMKKVLVMLATVAVCSILCAEELIVPAEGLNLSSAATKSSATLSGPLTISADLTVNGLTTVKNGGSFFLSQKSFTTKNLSIAADVTGTENVYDFAKLVSRFASGSITNDTDSVFARIQFAGGVLLWDHSTLTFGTVFHTKQGNGFILEGSDEHDVIIRVNNASRQLATGEGVIRFVGKDVRCIVDGAANNFKNLKLGTATIDWQNTGDLILTYNSENYTDGSLTCNAANQLPYERGRVVVDHANMTLDLNGFSQKVRSLISKGTVSTTSSDTTLTFGTGDTDGELSAPLGKNVLVTKTGTGTLTVTDSYLNEVSVDAGVFNVAVGNSGRVDALDITVASGAEIVVDGAVLAVQRLILQGDAKVTTKNGGIVEYAVEEKTVVEVNQNSKDTDIVKSGESVLVLKSADAIGGNIWIKEGTLGFSAMSCAAEWWRLTMKKAYTHDSKGSYPALGRFHLVNANGDFETAGITAADPDVGLEAVNLQNSKVTSVKQYATGRFSPCNAEGPKTLFSTTTTMYYGLIYQNAEPDPEKPETWEAVIFRLSSDIHAVTGYKMRTAWTDGNGMPICSWSLEASFDGVDWALVDERSDESTAPSQRNAIWYNSGNSQDVTAATPYLLSQCPGAAGFSATANVRVDTGARLDMSLVHPSSRGIGVLTVDCQTGGGEITEFSPLPNGTLYLIGSRLVKGGMVVPITFASVSNEENLASWKVYVDGDLTDKKLVYRDGSLQIDKYDFVLLIR